MNDSDFYNQLRNMQRNESGRDPVRGCLWWMIKTAAWLVLWFVVSSLTVVSCVGAYMGSNKLASLFGIVIAIMFVLSHFLWMGLKNKR